MVTDGSAKNHLTNNPPKNYVVAYNSSNHVPLPIATTHSVDIHVPIALAPMKTVTARTSTFNPTKAFIYKIPLTWVKDFSVGKTSKKIALSLNTQVKFSITNKKFLRLERTYITPPLTLTYTCLIKPISSMLHNMDPGVGLLTIAVNRTVRCFNT